ncbi:MAG: sugar phosphate nucleotidyltransferase [Myxococcota bacterium]
MKVVLFCGGLGLRLRDYSESIPKPLVRVGPQPILWNIMRYYAHYGHQEFILCLGYRGEAIKEFFLNYKEAMANDFTLTDGGTEIELHRRDIQDWKITFVDTGLSSNIGQRLMAVREYLQGDEMFLANYSDGLSNLPLDTYLDFVKQNDKIATFVSVRPTASFHAVKANPGGLVTSIYPVSEKSRINCGYFALKKEIFDHMEPGEELVTTPFQRLIQKEQLVTYEYDGFWECMDTFKDQQLLHDMHVRGDTPWEVWE